MLNFFVDDFAVIFAGRKRGTGLSKDLRHDTSTPHFFLSVLYLTCHINKNNYRRCIQ